MKLQYDDWMREVIAGGVREVMEGNSPVYEVPENILFREIEYTPQGILAEVQNRTEVGGDGGRWPRTYLAGLIFVVESTFLSRIHRTSQRGFARK